MARLLVVLHLAFWAGTASAVAPVNCNLRLLIAATQGLLDEDFDTALRRSFPRGFQQVRFDYSRPNNPAVLFRGENRDFDPAILCHAIVTLNWGDPIGMPGGGCPNYQVARIEDDC